MQKLERDRSRATLLSAVTHHCWDTLMHIKYPGYLSLKWHYGDVIMGSVSNRQSHDCLLNRLFRRRSKKTSKIRATGLCARNSPGTGVFPAQMASNAENVSIWWRHHGSQQPCDSLQNRLWHIKSHIVVNFHSEITSEWIVLFHSNFPPAVNSPNTVN